MASRFCFSGKWLWACAALSVSALVLGCGSSADGENRQGNASGGSGGAGVPTSLSFQPSSTLTLEPGEQRTLTLIAKPASSYHVRFALVGEPGNASLDLSEVDSNGKGIAHVGLTAPTTATTFRVRASIGTGTSTEAAVAVSAGGFETLTVHPDYNGSRLGAISQWVASVRAGTTCASLSGTPPPDGDLKATSDVLPNGFFTDPQIDSVPVGPALAVTVRAGHFAGGCVDVPALAAGQTNTAVVTVTDRPMQLDQTDLDVRLGIDTSSTAWAQAVSATIAQTADAMVDGAPDDVSALLDAMHIALGQSSAAVAFAQARQAGSWDPLLTAKLGAGASHVIRSPVKAWLAQGAATFGGADTFIGHLDGQGQAPGKADLTLASIAGLTPDAVGSPSDVGPVSWSADPGDTVLLGAQLSWMPSLLVTSLALAPAEHDVPTATTVPEALADQVDCTLIGNTLAGAGPKPSEAYPGCDLTCAAALCGNGLVVMWKRARDNSASNVQAATLDISAAGSVGVVDDEAVPLGFDGNWVGKLKTGQYTLSVGGSVQGDSSTSPP